MKRRGRREPTSLYAGASEINPLVERKKGRDERSRLIPHHGDRRRLVGVEGGLGLHTELAKKPMTAGAIARHFALLERAATDFLDALVSLDLLSRDGGGPDALYRNTPETARFLDRASPAYIGGILKLWDDRNFGFWADLTDALKTGSPQSEIKRSGRSFFETLYAEPRRLEAFMDAMTETAGPAVRNRISVFDARMEVVRAIIETNLLGGAPATTRHRRAVASFASTSRTTDNRIRRVC